MTMTHFSDRGLDTLCRQLNLQIVNLYYGTNSGYWTLSLPPWRLIFILESDGESFLGTLSHRVPCMKYNWYLLPPFCEIRHSLNESMLHLSIHFTATVSGNLTLTESKDTFFYGEDPETVEQIRTTLASASTLSLSLFFNELAYAKLRQVLTRDDSERIMQLYRIPEFASLADHLKIHATARTRVEEMATFCSMKTDSFIKHFTRTTGRPPGKFLAGILTEKAISLLSDGNHSIKTVAYALEFCNEFYFSRFFKKQTGLAPSDYQSRFSVKNKKE